MKVSIEDMFCIGGAWYLLSQVDYLKVALIGIKSANRWADPVKVVNIFDISAEEMNSILTGTSEIHQLRIFHRKELPDIEAFLNSVVNEAYRNKEAEDGQR